MDTLNDYASSLVRHGIGQLAAGDPASAHRALASFDRALGIRLGLAGPPSSLRLYDLAGTWMNRAEALTRLGGAARLDEALAAYDAALAALRALPLRDDVRFVRRLAIACQNRATTRRARGGSGQHLVMHDLMEAITHLEEYATAAPADGNRLLAAAWVGLAAVQADGATEPEWRRAIGSAAQARRLVATTEWHDVDAAQVGLTARYVCCRALARDLAQRPPASDAVPDDVHTATDIAEDGLALAGHWAARGVHRFAALAHDLHTFGAGLYAVFQPHFLEEFDAEFARP